MLTTDHPADFAGEFELLTECLGLALLLGAVTWLIYVALEPFLRRRWPGALISWNRLLSGRFADPLIGRDILVGVAALCAIGLVETSLRLVARWLELPQPNPVLIGEGTNLTALLGGRFVVSQLCNSPMIGLIAPLALLFVLLLLRILLRKQWLAVATLIVLFSVPGLTLVRDPRVIALILSLQIFYWSVVFFLLARFGVLSLCALYTCATLWNTIPGHDLTAWYAGATLTFYGAIVAIAVYGFYTSLAGRPLLATDLLPQE